MSGNTRPDSGRCPIAWTSPPIPSEHPTVRRASLVPVLLALLSSRVAFAQECPRASLTWSRAPGAEACLSREALVRDAEERLRRKTITDDPGADFAIRGEIERLPHQSGWKATFRVWDREGEYVGARELHSPAPDCKPLSDALGLVLALIVESPTEHVSLYLPPPAPEPPPPAPAPPPPLTRKPMTRATPMPPPVSSDSSLGAMFAGGFVPGFGYGLRLGSSLVGESWRVTWALGAWNRSLLREDSTELAVSSWQGEMHGCGAILGVHWFRLEPCGGLILGRATGEGRGFSLDEEAVEWALQLDARLDGTFAIDEHAFLRIEAGLAAGLIRPRFYYAEDGVSHDVWRMWPVAPHGAVAMGVKLR